MAKGISVRFKSYQETIPAVLKVIKLEEELKKHDKIILKPSLRNSNSANTNALFVEFILKFCIQHKKEGAEILIAEGSDGEVTADVFDSSGYKSLAEKYSVGLIDLNNSETEEEINDNFLKFDKIILPSILKNSFIISLPKLSNDGETEISGSLSNMLGAFPSSHYSGFFSSTKNKIRKWPIKYSIHDILRCVMPNLAVIDASEHGVILAGQPLEMDKQAAKILGIDWKSIPYIRLLDEAFSSKAKK